MGSTPELAKLLKKSWLGLNRVRFFVRLGCTAEERSLPQPVHFDLRIHFSSLPVGCTTDRLTDTVCYADLVGAIQRICQSREFHLIESLGLEVHQEIRKHVTTQTRVEVTVTKERPPVEGLDGGSVFHIADPEFGESGVH